MTVLVSVHVVGDVTRLRRYERGTNASLCCTHEGRYASTTVSSPNLLFYLEGGAPQDRIVIPMSKRSGKCSA